MPNSMKGMKGYKATKRRIYARDQGVCWRCGLSVQWDEYDLDHIVPRSRGGGHGDSNLAVAHRVENRGRDKVTRHLRGLPHAMVPRW